MNKETVYNELTSSVHNSYLENTMFSCQVLRVYNLIEFAIKNNCDYIAAEIQEILIDYCFKYAIISNIETKINYLEISDTNTDLLTDLCNSLKTTADNYKSKLYAKTGIIPPST